VGVIWVEVQASHDDGARDHVNVQEGSLWRGQIMEEKHVGRHLLMPTKLRTLYET
jgi:hypothetical protein